MPDLAKKKNLSTNPIYEVVAIVRFQSLWQLVGVILREGLFQSPSHHSLLGSDPEYQRG